MNNKHGLSQHRLNTAKGHASGILEEIQRIEMMFHMSQEKLIDEEIAEVYITRNIKSLHTTWHYLKSYIEQREDSQ